MRPRSESVRSRISIGRLVSSPDETLTLCARAPRPSKSVRTYRDVFALGEFRAIFAGQLASAAAMTIQTLAFSFLVYAQTASPLLAAAAFLAGSLPQALGALTFSGASDL